MFFGGVFGRFFCSFLVFFGAVLAVVFVSFWGYFRAVFVRLAVFCCLGCVLYLEKSEHAVTHGMINNML